MDMGAHAPPPPPPPRPSRGSRPPPPPSQVALSCCSMSSPGHPRTVKRGGPCASATGDPQATALSRTLGGPGGGDLQRNCWPEAPVGGGGGVAIVLLRGGTQVTCPHLMYNAPPAPLTPSGQGGGGWGWAGPFVPRTPALLRGLRGSARPEGRGHRGPHDRPGATAALGDPVLPPPPPRRTFGET